jgi:hypothetical protein
MIQHQAEFLDTLFAILADQEGCKGRWANLRAEEEKTHALHEEIRRLQAEAAEMRSATAQAEKQARELDDTANLQFAAVRKEARDHGVRAIELAEREREILRKEADIEVLQKTAREIEARAKVVQPALEKKQAAVTKAEAELAARVKAFEEKRARALAEITRCPASA